MTRSRGTGVLRRALAVALTLPLAGVVLVVAAPSASAAVTSPGNGTPFTSHTTIRISANYTASGTENVLSLAAPGESAVPIRRAPANRLNGGSFQDYLLDTGCWVSETCSGTRIAPNGTWTLTQSGSNGGPWTFVTRIAPRQPGKPTASVLSSREVRVSWTRGAEPDLTGYEIVEGSNVVQSGIGMSACEGSSCSAVVSYATDGSGEHAYAVRAFRSDGSGGTLGSATSPSSDTVRLEAAPAPAPEPTSGSGSGSGSGDGGSTGGSTGGSGDGGTGGGTGSGDGGTTGGGTGTGTGGSPSTGGGTGGTGGTAAPRPGAPKGTTFTGKSADEVAVAQRKAFALGFSAFGPKLGIPKLPPLPQSQAPAIAPELADGTFEPTLGFEDQVLTERVEVAQGPTARVRNVVGGALDGERLATSTAAALLLLLAGAHLRRWLGATHEE